MLRIPDRHWRATIRRVSRRPHAIAGRGFWSETNDHEAGVSPSVHEIVSLMSINPGLTMLSEPGLGAFRQFTRAVRQGIPVRKSKQPLVFGLLQPKLRTSVDPFEHVSVGLGAGRVQGLELAASTKKSKKLVWASRRQCCTRGTSASNSARLASDKRAILAPSMAAFPA